MVCSLHPESLPRAPAAAILPWGMVRGLEVGGAEGNGEGFLGYLEAQLFYKEDLFEEASQLVVLFM